MSDTDSHRPMRGGWKKRRLPGSCDACSEHNCGGMFIIYRFSFASSKDFGFLMFRKKVLDLNLSEFTHPVGDSANMPNNQCTNCLAFNLPCTHNEPTKRRGPKSPYVEKLEKRIEGLETVIRKFTFEDIGKQDKNGLKSPTPILSNLLTGPRQVPCSFNSNPPSIRDDDEDDFSHLELSRQMSNLSCGSASAMCNFWGPASGFKLLAGAHGVKTEYTGTESFNERHFKRRIYWEPHPWDIDFLRHNEPHYVFPEDDLLMTLVSLYFLQVNCYFPVIHAPTFKKQVADGLHLRNSKFGGVVLAVCALGARFSSDPRVLVDLEKETSAGWQYFLQVKIINGTRMLAESPTLHDLQYCCVRIRAAEELGLHRRMPEGVKLTPEYEQLKRAFWVLVVMDRMVSNFSGRPNAIREDEFDQELPVDVEDEFWDEGFQQPPDKPSSISCFISYIKLTEILAFALVTLFPTKKSRLMFGLSGNGWQERITEELDSSLNNWISTIPDHLRWDPDREDTLFFDQSAFLHANYYNVQIQIHRAFMQKPSPLMLPSLAICTNAARSCINLLHRQFERGQMNALPHSSHVLFSAGTILLMNIWSSKRAGFRIDTQREVTDVMKILTIMSKYDSRWVFAAKLKDILYELARGLPYFRENLNDYTPYETPTTATQPHPFLNSVAEERETASDSTAFSDPWYPYSWQRMPADNIPPLPLSSAELGSQPIGLEIPKSNGNTPRRTNQAPSESARAIAFVALSPMTDPSLAAAYYNKQSFNKQDDEEYDTALRDLPESTMWTTAPSALK
uniref:Xylanolytic transcriptional activator regulatory domain-containing protein n=1 Tax=Moniliophthora roreri TaxID=221103 RepID=A0A0W0FHI4_MONRR